MNQPVKKFRAGAITATVWINESNKEGVTFQYPTITFARSYQDKEGNWKSTSSMRIGDLPKASLVLSKAYEHLAMEGIEEALD